MRLIALTVSIGCSIASAQQPEHPLDIRFVPSMLVDDSSASHAAPLARMDTPRPSRRDSTDMRHANDSELLARLDERLIRLGEIEIEEGVNSQALLDELDAIAAIYFELGDDAYAVAMLDRARDISRRNRGLYSLDQVDIVEQMITAIMAAGDLVEFKDMQRYVLDLARRNARDPRVPQVLTAAADRQIDAALYILEHGLPFSIAVNLSQAGYGSPGRQRTPTKRSEALAALRLARRLYSDAMYSALAQPAANLDALLTLEQKIIDTFYFEAAHPDLHPRARPGYTNVPGTYGPGAAALQAKVANRARFGASDAATAQALIELGDWQLLHSANGAALERYREARDYLFDRGAPSALVNELLSPPTPRLLEVHQWRSELAADRDHYDGHIDIAVEISRYGSVKHVEVLGATEDTSRGVARRLRLHVMRQRFRPRFVDGEPARNDRFRMRYYYYAM